MIEVRGITKSFGTMRALDEGPNGAGKSTTMKIITTFLAPNKGTVLVDGIDVLEKPLDVRRRIGYLPENVPLYLDMNVHEYLKFVGQARGLSGGRLQERLDWCVEACGLTTEYKKTISELSKGFKQRTGLAQALIHDPDILILDEPTSGLDPLQIMGIRELIRSLAGSKTIIFSTHILQEVRPVTSRVAIINEGRLIADGDIEAITREAMVTNRIFLALGEDAAAVEPILRGLPGVEAVRSLPAKSGCRFEVRADFSADPVTELARAAGQNGWSLKELSEAPYTLEDTFISCIKRAHKGVA